jgi:hypothetical protein
MEIDRAAIIKRLEAMGIRFIPRRLLIGLVFLPIAIDHELTWSTGFDQMLPVLVLGALAAPKAPTASLKN